MRDRAVLIILGSLGWICILGTFTFAKEEWKEYKEKHFIIYFKETPKGFVETVGRAAEEYYEEIARNLGFRRYEGWTYDERAKIYIYNDAEDYVEAGKQSNWSHGVASPQDKVIRTFPTAAGFFDSTLPHEIGHIIFREFVGFKAQVPGWFEEGVAMYQEKAKRFGADKLVETALEDGSFIPLQELTHVQLTNKSESALVHLYYAQAASIINYMINELGEHRFVQFCRKLEDGPPFDWALKSVYVRLDNTTELNKAWVNYLKRD